MSRDVLSRCMGTWYLSYSTLSVWRNKGLPRCELGELVEKNGVVSWTDTVWTQEKGWGSSEASPKALVAKDTLTGTNPLTFRWRGKGWMSLIHCDCQVLAHDPDCAEYLVVRFGSTWFTRDGVDVMTRSPEPLTKQRLEKILAGLDPAARAVLKEQELVWLGGSGGP